MFWLWNTAQMGQCEHEYCCDAEISLHCTITFSLDIFQHIIKNPIVKLLMVPWDKLSINMALSVERTCLLWVGDDILVHSEFAFCPCLASQKPLHANSLFVYIYYFRNCIMTHISMLVRVVYSETEVAKIAYSAICTLLIVVHTLTKSPCYGYCHCHDANLGTSEYHFI